MRTILILLLLASFQPLFAQEFTQTIRGRVIDKQSQTSLPGATVVITSVIPNMGIACDNDGKFRFEKVPIGRHQLKVTFLGYNPYSAQLLLSAGKELVLSIEMEESAIVTKEVVITAQTDKSKQQNEMNAVSARMMSMEESNRYAGTRNDPARMAASFAGVVGGNDTRNDIIIRGNSPVGLLWRLEGVDIPNPNHFAVNGSSSGPISMLNNNTLANSDFMTSAFAAEYTNALSGVFDLKMRNGNNEKYEGTGQIGMNGVELGLEGPFSKKQKSASFLVNYRYSNLIAMQKLGINFGSGSLPIYQDGSYKINIPVKKGYISAYGLGGHNEIDLLAKNQKAKDLFAVNIYDYYFKGQMYTTGVSWQQFVGTNAYIRSTVAYGRDGYTNAADSSSVDLKNTYRYSDETYFKDKYSLNVLFNKKFSRFFTLRSGLMNDMIGYNYNITRYRGVNEDKQVYLDAKGKTYLSRAYTEGILKVSENLSVYPGISYTQLFFNNTYAIEPRLSASYKISNIHKLTLGYGLHSKMQDLSLYFYESPGAAGEKILTNKNLDFSKAHHFVLGYDYSITEHMRIKSEVYYQQLFNVPVEKFSSSFSFVNAGAGFGIPMRPDLVNRGTGTNYGLELTIERFFHKGYYFLLTNSVYQSKYKGSDGVERNTAFNGNYVGNALIGKEFKLKERNTIAIDYKVTVAGGRRYSPVDTVLSRMYGESIYDNAKAYSLQFPVYFKTDIKIAYRLNTKGITHEIAASLENFTNHKNLYNQEYNPKTGQVVKIYQLGFFPVGFYRINF